MGRKACTGAGLAARRIAARRAAALRLRVFAALASGPDGIGAVPVDGHVCGLRPAGRALDGDAARSGHQQGDQVLPVGHLQRLDDLFRVARLIVLEQGTLQGLALGGLFHEHRLEGVGVEAGVEHTGAHGAGRGIKILHLLGAHMVLIKVLCQIDGILEGAARVAGHEVGHEVLLFACLLAQLVELILELVEGLDGGLAHVGEGIGGAVLGRDLQLAGNVVLHQLFEEGVVGVGHQVVKADAAADKDLLDAAMQRAAEVALYFSHTRPDGSSCFSATDKMEAENIAGGQSSAAAVMTSWMNSAGHRANILTSYFKTIGIGCFTQGGTVFWVQCFGTDTPATISQPADKNVVVTVTVDGDFLSKTKLTLDSSSYNLKVGNKKTVKLYVQNPEWASQNVLLDNRNFTFKSYNTKKATISATGKINAKTVGKYKIKATLKNATGTSVTKSGKITFPQPKIKVTVKKKKAIVTWKKLKAAKGYYVYRREAKGKKYTKWKKVKNIKKNTTVKYKDSKLKKGKTYQYKVVAYNRKNKGTSAIKKIVIK